ncbi:uncharacterized protein LOC110628234 isoform X2 [Manihot esculenta]|uniref:Uncharacterized protein n=1 Tax=Manihot esculenta TaxID=3983 RepID=A0ACB7IBV5_MANES|nr:uncharacterized protein LOC110628234 isoform X2 [Manihot esculenta]KAG8661965.1 hypothetical protein MANES_01G052200v8 [Manihot esculenta]
MAITLLSIPTSPQTLFSHRLYANTNTCLHGSAALLRYPSKSFIPLSSSSSSLTSAAEDNPPPPSPDPLVLQSESATVDADEPPVGGCKACGRQEIEKGCNGEGRIQGGIATVPGFGWWPIKAYRPCPRFVASGGRYRRQGQSMDEVAFGRGEKGTPIGSSTEVEYSNKRGDPRRFKR